MQHSVGINISRMKDKAHVILLGVFKCDFSSCRNNWSEYFEPVFPMVSVRLIRTACSIYSSDSFLKCLFEEILISFL